MKNKQLLTFAVVASDQAIEAEKNLYKSEEGRASEAATRKLSRILREAIKLNDPDVLFELEKIALERDKKIFGAEESRSSSLGSLSQIYGDFKDSFDIEKAKNYLRGTNGNVLPKRIPKNDSVQNYISSAKSKLTQMIGSTSSPAKKTYYGLRKEALDKINERYKNNLNLALGKKIEKERGFER